MVELKSRGIDGSVWMWEERIWERSPEGNALVSVKGRQAFEFTLPTGCTQSGRVSSLKEDVRVLLEGGMDAGNYK